MKNIVNGGVWGGDETKSYDLFVVMGFARYLCFGLPPGGFESACISGDYEFALNRASYNTRSSSMGGGLRGAADQDVVANMIEFVKDHLPKEARGGQKEQWNWIHKGGISKDKDLRLLVKLGTNTRWVSVVLEHQGLTFDWETGEYH